MMTSFAIAHARNCTMGRLLTILLVGVLAGLAEAAAAKPATVPTGALAPGAPALLGQSARATPATATVASAAERNGKDLPYGHPDFYPSPEHPVGWLGNGSGHFLGAEPPLDVDEYQGKGILWKLPMPFFSQTQPIVVGNRVFTTSEPGTMICVEADTGRILWQDSLAWLALKDGFAHVAVGQGGSNNWYHWGGSWGATMSDGHFVAQGFRPQVAKQFAELYPSRPKPLLMVWDVEGRRHWAKGGFGGDPKGPAQRELWQKKSGPSLDWLSVNNFMSYQVLHLCHGKILQPVSDRDVKVIAHDLRTGKEVWRGPGYRNPHDEGMTPIRIAGRDMIAWPDGQVLDANTGKLLGNVLPDGALPIDGFDNVTPVASPDQPDVVVFGVMCYSLFTLQEDGSWELRDFTKKRPSGKVMGGFAIMPIRIVAEPSGGVRGEPVWKRAGISIGYKIQASNLGVTYGRVFAMPQSNELWKSDHKGTQRPHMANAVEHPDGEARYSLGMDAWDAQNGSYTGFSLFGNYYGRRTVTEGAQATWTDDLLAEWRLTPDLAIGGHYAGIWHYQRTWMDKRGYLWTQDSSGWLQVFDRDGKRVATLKIKSNLAAMNNAVSFPQGNRLYVRTWPALYCLSNEDKPKASGPTLTQQIRSAADKVDDALLLKALASRYQDDRDAAVNVIGALSSERQTTLVAKVSPLLNDKVWQTHKATMQALVAIGTEAKTLLPGWFDESRKAMESKDWFQAETLYESCAGIVADGNADRARRIAEELKLGAVEVKLGGKTARFNGFSLALLDFCNGTTDPVIAILRAAKEPETVVACCAALEGVRGTTAAGSVAATLTEFGKTASEKNAAVITETIRIITGTKT